MPSKAVLITVQQSSTADSKNSLGGHQCDLCRCVCVGSTQFEKSYIIRIVADCCIKNVFMETKSLEKL